MNLADATSGARGALMSRVVRTVRVLDQTMDLDLIARSAVNVMVTASQAHDRITCARRIHQRSERRPGRFVYVCSGTKSQVPADAVDEWFAWAAGGTLFIDHIGDLSSQAQDRLSTLLAEKSQSGCGTTRLDSDPRVRVIVGSDRSLRTDLAVGTFSEVLFYRLNVIHIDQMHQHES